MTRCNSKFFVYMLNCWLHNYCSLLMDFCTFYTILVYYMGFMSMYHFILLAELHCAAGEGLCSVASVVC